MIEIIVKNSKLITLPRIDDGIDGSISAAENFNHIPFAVKRVYYIYNLINQKAIRGKHAHKKLEQALFCINGACEIGLDDGTLHQEITLDTPNTGIYLGVELWHTMKNFSNNCILLVLASDVYKKDDYIRDYDEFKKYIDLRRRRRVRGGNGNQ
ncbi:MAG: FdtA/QdtA family cupin domain-containing protein [Candidatus Aminicenantes bacterium]|nr:FdtA/QdtA family cupin domain-containing protein [Candidatus Aminicenantes bacterium]